MLPGPNNEKENTLNIVGTLDKSIRPIQPCVRTMGLIGQFTHSPPRWTKASGMAQMEVKRHTGFVTPRLSANVHVYNGWRRGASQGWSLHQRYVSTAPFDEAAAHELDAIDCSADRHQANQVNHRRTNLGLCERGNKYENGNHTTQCLISSIKINVYHILA